MTRSRSNVDTTLLETVVETTTNGVVILDDNDVVAFANRVAERLLGYDPGTLAGSPVSRLFPDEQLSTLEIVRAWTPFEVDPSDGFEREFTMLNREGREVSVRLSVRETEYEGRQFYTVAFREAPEYPDPTHWLSTERHRRATLFETSSDPIVDCDFRDGKPVVRAVNDAFESVFGYDADSVVGRPLDSVLVPDEEHDHHRSLVRRLLHGEQVRAEVRRRTADGPCEFLLRVFPFEASGNSGAYAIYTDISERTERERELREAKERFETVFEYANDAILIFDPERNRYEQCNPQACDLLGYTREELLSLPPADIHLTEWDLFEEFIVTVVRDGSGWTDQLCCFTVDDEVLPTEISASRIEIDDRPHVLALVRDVSERRKAEQEIRQRSAAMETTTDGMAILDANGKYLYVNEAHAAIYGYDDPIDLVGGTWTQLYDEDEVERLDTEILHAVRRDGRWRGEAVGRRKDGSTFPQELTLTELDDGELVYVVRDITEHKAHERKLEALSEVSHELMVAEDTEAITRRTLATLGEVLESDIACIRLFDEDANALELAATTDEAQALLDRHLAFDLDATLAGRAYRHQEVVVAERDEDVSNRLSVHLPLGDHGTMTAFVRPADTDDPDVHYAELLAAGVRVALERSERDRMLRENERELRQQRDQLGTLNEIATLIEELIQRLTSATTREEINQTVCDRLVTSGFYERAWIGAADVTDEDVTPTVGAGIDDDYLDALDTMPTSEIGNGVVVRAIRTGEVQIVRQYQLSEGEPALVGPETDPPHEMEAVAAVPLMYGSQIYGVLVIDTSREDAFGETPRAALGVLGDVVGFAINAALNRKLLLSDTIVELEFEVDDDRSTVVSLSDRLGCRCHLEHETALQGGAFLSYLRLFDVPLDEALAAAEAMPSITESRVVGEHDGDVLLEVTKTESTSSVLIEVGATVRTMTAEEGVGRLVAEAPLTADIRDVVEAFRRRYPHSDLVAKRDVNHPVKTAAEFRGEVEEALTDKQRVALESAYASGYYDWPRENTAAELADSLGVSSPTLHQHLRKAEQKLLDAFMSGTDDH
ncbi:PAS domain S-box protein [Halomarina ordinaria]|uniref:PAS domain S-box protein n=1 Tax=Halomarina ordinaria TaxID=3033939 RepID=A0ABD5UD85_9EURY|nr:PAS domain S-box protein [Halomarina sp. PSRA2]